MNEQWKIKGITAHHPAVKKIVRHAKKQHKHVAAVIIELSKKI